MSINKNVPEHKAETLAINMPIYPGMADAVVMEDEEVVGGDFGE